MNKTIATIIVMSVLLVSACTRPESAIATLEGQGYENVQITGYKLFGCSEDDTFRTGFTATDQRGRTVSGVVCGDWFKGDTVRITGHN